MTAPDTTLVDPPTAVRVAPDAVMLELASGQRLCFHIVSPTSASVDTTAQDLLRVTDDGTFEHGSAEPWIANVLTALLVANASRNVVEIGGFQGRTSRALLKAMQALPWAKSFTVCELEPERAALVQAALDADGHCNYAKVVIANSLDWIPTIPAGSLDLVWLDGNHEKQHVLFELQGLLSKMAPGGLICGHDCFGSCDLQQVFSLVASQVGWRSMSLDLPRIGPAGGIGLLQRPR